MWEDAVMLIDPVVETSLKDTGILDHQGQPIFKRNVIGFKIPPTQKKKERVRA